MIRSYRPYALVLLLMVSMVSVSSCSLWPARKTMKEVRIGIQEAEKHPIEEEGLYHLSAAKRLLEAAEAEYEEADFVGARKLAREAKKQVDLAIEISKIYSQDTP